MKQIARWAVVSMAAVAACATLPAVADGTATVDGNVLTLSGLVTNVTAEADLGASVTKVVMTEEGGVASLADRGQKRRKRLKGLPLGVASVFFRRFRLFAHLTT